MGEENISYVEYLAKYLDKNVKYSEYADPEPTEPINYAEYMAEQLSEPDDISAGFNFQLVQQVAAQTIGLDLVAVMPMPAPLGNVMYMDHGISFEEIPVWNKDKTYNVDEFFNDNTFEEY